MGNLRGFKKLISSETEKDFTVMLFNNGNDLKEFSSISDFLNDDAFDKNVLSYFYLEDDEENYIINICISDQLTEDTVFKMGELDELFYIDDLGCIYSNLMHQRLSNLVSCFDELDEEDMELVKESMHHYDQLPCDYLSFRYNPEIEDFDPEEDEQWSVDAYPLLPDGIWLWDTFTDYNFD